MTVRTKLNYFGDGISFGSTAFRVTRLGANLLTGKSGTTALLGFPNPGEGASLTWNQASQNCETSGKCGFEATPSCGPAQTGTGFVWAGEISDPSPTPSAQYQFNSTGGTNTITRAEVGSYQIIFPGLGDASAAGGTVEVSARVGPSPASCKIQSWSSFGADISQRGVLRSGRRRPRQEVQRPVHPTPAGYRAGVSMGERFRDRLLHASPHLPGQPDGCRKYHSMNGTGSRATFFSGPAGSQGTAMVTAYGTGSERCVVGGWISSAADEVVIV